MTTAASIGHGTLIQIFDTAASPDAWKTLAEVTGITPPALARDTQDATHTESPEGWREFIAGLKDGGQVSCELNFVPDSDTTALLLASLDKVGAAAVQLFRIIFPDGNQTSPITASVWAFSAILTGFSPEAPVDGKMAASATFKVTGKPVLTRAV